MDEVVKATDDFSPSRLIGKGGFGDVFWGMVRGTKVAVKLLTKEGAGQLKPEVTALTRYRCTYCLLTRVILCDHINTCRFRHANLVELLGYCSLPSVIVYEFMGEGSLYDHLHGKVST